MTPVPCPGCLGVRRTELCGQLLDALGLDAARVRMKCNVGRVKVPLIRLHDVRNTYATISLRSGVHAEIVSSRLGHAKVAFTLDTYTEDVPDLDAGTAEQISGLFLPKGDE
jgi:integrase